MTTATLTPFRQREATKVGRRVYRKQILPLGSIDYKGQKITFDEAYLTDLANSFKEGAYDQVPFVLADEENRHNMNPERFRGEVKAFELTADGLDAILEVNEEGAKVLEQNPRLGVSARLVEGLAKADGRKFGRAVQHVLGTMDPRVTGLRPWQAVDLAEDTDIQVVDLTTETYEGDVMTAPAQPKPVEDQPLDLSTLSAEDLDALLEAADEDTPPADEPKPDVAPQVTDVDPDEVDEDDEDDDEEEVVVEDNTVDTDLSDDGSGVEKVVDTNVRDDNAQLRIDLANERFKTERGNLVRAGVPPFLIDLAQPLLASPDEVTIDLSNSDTPVNATKVVRDLLEGVKGIVDVKPEVGHLVDLSESDDEEAALMKQWDTEYGSA